METSALETPDTKGLVTTDSAGFAYTDVYRRQLAPNKMALVKAFEATAYTCANLNANAIACCNLRLYSRNKPGQRTRFFPTASVNRKRKNYIADKLKLRLSTGEEIEEITSHPLLDLLNNPNSELDGYSLFEVTQLFQEITGTAFWYVVKDGIGRPQEIYYLKSQFVRVQRNAYGKVVAFEYGYGPNRQTFDPEDIITFAMPNLLDDVEGMSPLRAAWQAIAIDNKLDAQLSAMLDNNARPDLIVSPKGDGYIGRDEQLRYETKFRQKFSRAGNGGVFFLEEDSNVVPLNFNPRDLSCLEFKNVSKVEIANAYFVPMAMLETKDVNKANLEASRLQHALNAILPRARRLEARLNKYLVPLYDDSGRLFVAFDDPSPENRKEKLAEITGLVEANIITVNEARNEYALASHVDGDRLFEPMPGMPELPSDTPTDVEDTADTGAETGPGEAPVAPDASPQTDSVQNTALNGAQVTSLLEIVQQVTGGLLPIEAARGLIQAAFPALSTEAVNAILDPLEGFKPQQPETPGQAPAPGSDNAPPDGPGSGKGVCPPDSCECDSGADRGIKSHSGNRPGSLPDGKPLAEVLRRFYASLETKVFNRLEKSYGAEKALPESFVPLSEWSEELADECRPLIELFVSEGGEALIDRVGASPDVFSVTNPHTAKAIQDAAFAFSDSTLQSTAQEINKALQDLRDSLSTGLTEGERLTDLRDRVKAIFTGLSDQRADLIGQTEASRAHHLGQRIAGIDSGVVIGWKWLLSSDACPLCKKIADDNKKGIGLNDNFAVLETGNPAYNDVPYAPAHPGCRCAVIERLDSDIEM